MKILMRNMGMTLHVINKLRAEGLDNVKVNMDWQHLLMNGEHLPEYAALLPPRGCSATSTPTPAGARSTTTTWSARPRSWRRSSSRSSCAAAATARTASASASTSIRTPRTRSARSGARCSSGGSSTRSPREIDDAALREAQSRKDAVRAYELVYAALGA